MISLIRVIYLQIPQKKFMKNLKIARSIMRAPARSSKLRLDISTGMGQSKRILKRGQYSLINDPTLIVYE